VRHAWTVRAAIAQGATSWSEPLFFEVERSLSDEELSLALEILRSRTLDRIEGPVLELAAGVTGRGARVGADVEALSHRGVVRAAPTAGIVPSVPAALRVNGEVRTPDTGDPDGLSRWWGAGRVTLDSVSGTTFMGFEFACNTEGIHYGLSDVIVEWGSAANACPAGTWVCKESEIEGCDTVRQNTVVDAVTCGGQAVDLPAGGHRGWLAGQGDFLFAQALDENGTTSNEAACANQPVWCCWD
jgi:hypothetical protein